MKSLFLLLLIFVAANCVQEPKQASPEPILQRLFVQDSDLPRMGNYLADFVPINNGLLANWIRENTVIQQNRVASTPQLLEANLVAGLVGDDLVSDLSQLKIQYQNDERSTLALSPWGLALRPLSTSAVMSDRISLLSKLQVQAGASLNLSIDDSKDLWFSWSLRAKVNRIGRQLGFDFQFPEAPKCTLFLRVPPLWEVEGDDCIVTPLPSLKNELPTTWPASVLESAREGEVWWKLEIGNTRNTRIWLKRSDEFKAQKFQHWIQSQTIEYRITNAGIELYSKWIIDGNETRSSETPDVILPQGLNIQEVICDGKPAVWTQIGSRLHFSNAREEPAISPKGNDPVKSISSSESQWSLRALLVLNEQSPESLQTLPQITLADSFVFKGASILNVDSSTVQLTKIDIDRPWSKTPLTANNEIYTIDTWSGNPPIWKIAKENIRVKQDSEVFVQIKPQLDSIAASVAIKLLNQNAPQTRIPIQVADGWIIESVSSSEPQSTVAIEANNGEASKFDLVFFPPLSQKDNSIEMQLRYQGNFAGVESLAIPSSRVLQLLGTQQSTVYVLEKSGSFALRTSLPILRDRIQEAELTEWQQLRLPRMADIWVLRPKNNEMPQLVFDQQPSTFTGELETRLEPASFDQSALSYRIQCKPISGSVARVRIDTTGRIPSNIAWRIIKSRDRNSQEWAVTSDASPDRTMITIPLDAPSSEPFSLEGFVTIPNRDVENFPLLSLPDAASQTSVVRIDSTYSVEDIDERFDVLISKEGSGFFGATLLSYDSSMQIALRVRSQRTVEPESDLDSSFWIAKQTLTDTLFATNQIRHHIDWMVEGDFKKPLPFQVPGAWSIVDARIDGSSVLHDLVRAGGESFKLEILPPKQFAGEHHVELIFDSFMPDRKELGLLISPEISILESSHRLWLPNGWFPGKAWVQWRADAFTSFLELRNPFSSPSPQLPSSISHPIPELILLSEDWRMYEIDRKDSENASSGRGYTICSSASEKAWLWFAFLFGLGFGLFFQPSRVHVTIAFAMVLWIVLDWLDGIGVYLFRAAIVGLLFAMTLCLLQRIIRMTSGEIDNNSTVRGSGIAKQLLSKSSLGCILISSICNSSLGQGGDDDSTLELVTPASKMEESSSSLESAFLVVVPIDASGNIKGQNVYISKALFKQMYADKKDYFVIYSSRYQCNLSARDSFTKAGIELVMNLEIGVVDPKSTVRLPLLGTQADFRKFSVNDVDVALGPKLRLDTSQGLSWYPEREGRYRLRIVVEPKVESSDSEFKISVAIPKIANAQLEMSVPAEFASDLRVESIGQLTNPATGKFSANLGPVSSLDVSWGGSVARSNGLVSSSLCEVWIDTRSRLPIGYSQVSIPSFHSSKDILELEGPDDWQPIGIEWGNAKLLNVSSGGSPGIARYRLAWLENRTDEESGNAKLIQVWWTPASEATTQLSIPSLEIAGSRPSEKIISTISASRSDWKMQSIDALSAVDPKKPPQMLQHSEESNIESYAYRATLGPKALPILRKERGSLSAKPIASYEMHFSETSMDSRFQATWNDIQTNRPKQQRILFPKNLDVTETKINDIPCDSTIFDFSEHFRAIVVQAKNGDAIRSLEVSGRAHDHQRKKIPLFVPQLEGDAYSSYQVVALSDAYLPTKFENLDYWSEEVKDTSTLLSAFQVPLWTKAIPLQKLAGQTEDPEWPSVQIDSPKALSGRMITSINRVNGNWNFRFDIAIDKDANVSSGVLIEIPSPLIAQLQIDCPYTVHSTPDANHRVIFANPSNGEDRSLLSIQGSVEGSDTKGFSIPEIKLVGGEKIEAYCSLPRAIGSNPLGWKYSSTVTPVEDPLLRSQIIESSNSTQDSLVFRLSGPKSNLSVSAEKSEVKSVECPVVHHEFLYQAGEFVLESHYIIQASHERSLDLVTPDGVELLGVLMHGIPLSFRKARLQSFEIFPSDLPIVVRVVSRQRAIFDSQGRIDLTPPNLQSIIPTRIYWSIHSPGRLISERFDIAGNDELVQRVSDFEVWHGMVKQSSKLLEGKSGTLEKDLIMEKAWGKNWSNSIRTWFDAAQSSYGLSHSMGSELRSDVIEALNKFDLPNIDLRETSSSLSKPIQCWRASPLIAQEAEWRYLTVRKAKSAMLPPRKITWSALGLAAAFLMFLRYRAVDRLLEALISRPWILLLASAALGTLWFQSIVPGLIFGGIALIQKVLSSFYAWQFRTQRKAKR